MADGGGRWFLVGGCGGRWFIGDALALLAAGHVIPHSYFVFHAHTELYLL